MAAHFSGAQEKKQYEVKNFSGLVNITGPSSLVIEGYSGKSVIIEAESGEGKVPEKAAGLRVVTSGGLDNTGLSVTVEEQLTKVVTSINEKGEEKEEEIRMLNINIPNPNQFFKNYVIKVPHGLTTRFRQSNGDFWERRGALEIRSLEGELDVNCSGCNLNISGFSGNIIASNSYGGTTRIEFSKLAQDKITAINSDGELEVIFPANTKANLRMSSGRGNIYTDFDLKKAGAKTTKDPLEPVTVVGISSYAPARSTAGQQATEIWGSTPAGVTSSVQGSYAAAQDNALTRKRLAEEKLLLASVAAAKSRSLDRYDYTINDGGVYVSITTYGGNIYLKKK